MDDVADEAGITRLIVYRHFDSKEDLYRAVLERVVTRLGEEFTDAESAVRPLLTVAREDPDAFRLLWAHAAHEPRFAAYVADFREAAVEFADELVGSRIADTRLRRWAMIVIVDHLYDAVLTWLDVGDPEARRRVRLGDIVRVAGPHHGLGRAAMTAERIEYDELALFHENADEYGIPWAGPPVVARTAIEVDRASGRAVSALLWGVASPEIVFVHGGAQNAHTWDTVALALGRSALAVDLPGHGHSGWRDDLAYSPVTNAEDIAIAIEHLAPDAAVVVGMSLGGLTSIALAARRPDLVRRLMLVDVTPGVDRGKAKAIIDFVNGPQTFPSFDDIMKRTVEHNPTRSEASLRRGILHNAHQLDDGSWAWNYDRRHRGGGGAEGEGDIVEAIETNPLWDDLSSLTMPIMLLRGSLSPVVDDTDVAEVKRRQPTAEVVVVDGAGHSIQGDKPLELAALIERFAF